MREKMKTAEEGSRGEIRQRHVPFLHLGDKNRQAEQCYCQQLIDGFGSQDHSNDFLFKMRKMGM